MSKVLAALVLAAMLAGCAVTSPQATSPESGYHATATTGVLRGVVVDDGIRPVAEANVMARGPGGKTAAAATDLAGQFGFDGLAPGAWRVSATKPGYEGSDVVTDVVAGREDPPIIKVQLAFVPGSLPFATSYHYEGFIQCIVPGGNLCGNANLYVCFVAGQAGQPCPGNVTSDNSVFYVKEPLLDQRRTPDWVQVEVVWQSTQAVTDWLQLHITPRNVEDVENSGESADGLGHSPLVLTLNATSAASWKLGTEKGILVETLGGGNDQTCGAAPSACTGIQVNQRVDYYFHFFYGYVPPEGWAFSTSGEVPPPGMLR